MIRRTSQPSAGPGVKVRPTVVAVVAFGLMLSALSVPAQGAGSRSSGPDPDVLALPGVQPDGMIKSPGVKGYLGKDIFNLTAVGQTGRVTAAKGTAQTFIIKVRNAGSVQGTFLATGAASTPDVTIRYLTGSNKAPVDVTAAVVAGTQVVGVVNPGRSSPPLKAELTLTPGAPVGASQVALVSFRDAVLPGEDAVAASLGFPSPTAQVTAGGDHSCALLVGGKAKCWGDNLDGELGDGTNTDSAIPVLVNGLANGTDISAGGWHTCAIVSDPAVMCWGYNYDGELGNGTNTDSNTPVMVTGLAGTTDLSAGMEHTCAVLTDMSVKCWGENYFGALGNGNNNDSNTPVSVNSINTATQVAAGEDHTCALLADTTVQCWGRNFLGQLGDGSNTNTNSPVAVTGLIGATQIAAGSDHTCALLTDTTVKCWGGNFSGELGNGTFVDSNVPVAVPGLLGATQITAGSYVDHTCVLVALGAAKCWGNNLYGELGNGQFTTGGCQCFALPVTVTTLVGAVQIVAGANHSCALMTINTIIKCWGNNAYGQLGNNSLINSNKPVTVLSL